MQAEPLAEYIRKCNSIVEIIVENKEKEIIENKISQYADDTQFFCATEEDIIKCFEFLETYCKASGAKINYNKTKGLYIGRWKKKEPRFNKIKWVKSVIGLGTVFGYNINYEELWLRKFTKFKTKIIAWKKRELSFTGKKTINSDLYCIKYFIPL